MTLFNPLSNTIQHLNSHTKNLSILVSWSLALRGPKGFPFYRILRWLAPPCYERRDGCRTPATLDFWPLDCNGEICTIFAGQEEGNPIALFKVCASHRATPGIRKGFFHVEDNLLELRRALERTTMSDVRRFPEQRPRSASRTAGGAAHAPQFTRNRTLRAEPVPVYARRSARDGVVPSKRPL